MPRLARLLDISLSTTLLPPRLRHWFNNLVLHMSRARKHKDGNTGGPRSRPKKSSRIVWSKPEHRVRTTRLLEWLDTHHREQLMLFGDSQREADSEHRTMVQPKANNHETIHLHIAQHVFEADLDENVRHDWERTKDTDKGAWAACIKARINDLRKMYREVVQNSSSTGMGVRDGEREAGKTLNDVLLGNVPQEWYIMLTRIFGKKPSVNVSGQSSAPGQTLEDEARAFFKMDGKAEGQSRARRDHTPSEHNEPRFSTDEEYTSLTSSVAPPSAGVAGTQRGSQAVWRTDSNQFRHYAPGNHPVPPQSPLMSVHDGSSASLVATSETSSIQSHNSMAHPQVPGASSSLTSLNRGLQNITVDPYYGNSPSSSSAPPSINSSTAATSSSGQQSKRANEKSVESRTALEQPAMKRSRVNAAAAVAVQPPNLEEAANRMQIVGKVLTQHNSSMAKVNIWKYRQKVAEQDRIAAEAKRDGADKLMKIELLRKENLDKELELVRLQLQLAQQPAARAANFTGVSARGEQPHVLSQQPAARVADAM
ncbi:hypothetical protein DAEQUDRAFT_786013 [Daedalea quercina L-15889]|uniref:Uncharacterized protein n=1 Tax=Daedalea quercina L-15889 TaxID=1314783 RepID=A0A165QF16_9APHY|nr:hypothetical protein DAEQUDRAFT_786013 [Daedalea quercina L-15889]